MKIGFFSGYRLFLDLLDDHLGMLSVQASWRGRENLGIMWNVSWKYFIPSLHWLEPSHGPVGTQGSLGNVVFPCVKKNYENI